MRAERPCTTGPTIGLAKPHLDIRAARVVDPPRPAARRLALWAVHLLACPVDREVLDGIAPSMCDCQLLFGRAGPRSVMPCSSRLVTSNAASM